MQKGDKIRITNWQKSDQLKNDLKDEIRIIKIGYFYYGRISYFRSGGFEFFDRQRYITLG